MTEQMLGYALARYAILRGEPEPEWAEHIDNNPRTYMRRAAAVVRRIFTEYVAGLGVTAIANRLNADDIPCPSASG